MALDVLIGGVIVLLDCLPYTYRYVKAAQKFQEQLRTIYSVTGKIYVF